MKWIVIADDSPLWQAVLTELLQTDPEIEVLATAADGLAAIEAAARLKPDLILMDIIMPKLDGLEATRRIMASHPVPIILLSSAIDPHETEKSFRAIQAGAVSVLGKPPVYKESDRKQAAAEIVRMVKLMSEVKVVKRRVCPKSAGTLIAASLRPDHTLQPSARSVKAVFIGASAGGPSALQTLLTHLPKDLPVPVLIVQHLAKGFMQGLRQWLQSATGFTTRIAVNGEIAAPGQAYLAPDDFQMGIEASGKIVLSRTQQLQAFCPSVAWLFNSALQAFGRHSAAVLMTGMGRDGAHELGLLKEEGAVTIVQDRASSLVYGMPGAAVEKDAARYVLPPDRIARKLHQLTGIP